MKKLETHETIKPAKFYQFKQLQYFKQIIRKTQDFHLKQILPLHVHKLSTRVLDHDKYSYILQKSIDQCVSGILIDQSITQLSKKTTVFRLDKKLNKILQQVLTLPIPVITALKTHDKFKILNSCLLQKYPFNRTIYRKGEQFRGVYYIIQGQVKLVCERNSQANRLISKNNFIGFRELESQSCQYLNTVLSNANNTELLFISFETLYGFKIQDSQLNLKQLFLRYYQDMQQNFIVFQNVSTITKRKLQQQKKSNKTPLKLNNFVKKTDQFMSKTTRQDTGFNQYVKSKKILLQLRQTMAAARLNRKNRKNNNLDIKVNSFHKKRSKLNTNLSSCRSVLLKQHILKRLTWSKNFQDSQTPKILAEQMKIINTKE